MTITDDPQGTYLTAPRSIGTVPWTDADIKAEFQSMLNIYGSRPIVDNNGGMKIPHLLAMWFYLRRTKPKVIIESGVYKGQGTWLFHQASPETKIFSIDIHPHNLTYKCPQSVYLFDDFTTYDWKKMFEHHGLADVAPEDVLVFFDDHQDIVKRVKWIKENTPFKKIIDEDNYPVGQGDAYSFKKALEDPKDSIYLKSVLKTYYEFPPPLMRELTRWGTEWSDYPTKPPLYKGLPKDELMLEELDSYTWICYAELK